MPPKGRKSAVAQGSVRSKVQVDVRESVPGLWGEFESNHGLHHTEDRIIIFKEIVPMKLKPKSLNIDSGWKITEFHCSTDSPSGIAMLTNGTETRAIRSYQKRIALLEPYRYMKFKERGFQPFLWNFQPAEVSNAENQAYVDVIGSALASKLKKLAKSPHFCDFYGSFRAVAKTFLYNLEEDLEDFRFTRWFWEGIEDGGFGLRVVNKKTGDRLSLEDVKMLLKPDEEYLTDAEDSDSDSESSRSTASLGAESLPCDAGSSTPFVGGELLEETDLSSVASCTEKAETLETLSTSSNETDGSFSDDFSVHAELYNMPVAVMFLEHMEGTMDELLEDSKFTPVKTAGQQKVWSAWLTQVIMALGQLQGFLNLTHNDLHTNNILWKSTTEEFLWYSDGKGQVWRVPTYGKVFTIIDYGRSIYSVNGYTCISSDYDDGHDAAGMYNFGPIEDKTIPRVGPCKSFDLCRLACSLLRGLYPRNPEEKLKGKVLTKEGSWVVRETEDGLFNALWTWLSNSKGESILETESGEEKYPGFDLYQVIAATVKSAVPSDQLKWSWIAELAWKGAVPVGIAVSHVPV